MGIYIKGMKMPTSCQKCPFLDYEEGFCFASGVKGKRGWYGFTLCPCGIEDRRHDDCPLVPVLPHGRLIDADDIEQISIEWEHGEIAKIIAPTIIQAEEG